MHFHPFDLSCIIHSDLTLVDVLLERIERGQGSREMLVAELIAATSSHIAASDAVVAPAVEEHVENEADVQVNGGQTSAGAGIAAGIASGIVAENRQVAAALLALEETTGAQGEAAVAEVHAVVKRRLADLSTIPGTTSGVIGALRDAVGDTVMIELGREFIAAKRRAPTRPHTDSNSAILRIVGVIDRVKDASSGRAILAATDGSGLLNPQAQAVVNALAELRPKPLELLEPEQARRQPAVVDAVNRLLEDRDEDVLPPFVARVEDTTIITTSGELTVRIYEADPDTTGRSSHGLRLKPVVMYVHGGGWVTGDIYSSDTSPRSLALLVDAVVISVEYRKAPEHRFPAAHDDVLAALVWLQENATTIGADPSRIAIVGESAGANMAVAACLGVIRSGAPVPLAQIIVYPVTSLDRDWPSYREHADAKPLHTAMLDWFTGHLLADPGDADDRLDLLTAPDSDLARLPPTLIITAERDPLHDQGVALADRLKQLGVPTALREYRGVPHEFFGMSRVLDEACDAQAATAELLVSAFLEASLPDALEHP